MPFLGALTAGNLETMRGTSTVEPRHVSALYVSLCPNTNVYTARVNQATFSSPLAQLTYDGGSGTLADVLVGMTVLVSKTNDRAAAFFRGRVRAAPSASILYINETDGTQFDDDDYIFVIDDFALHEKMARDVLGVLYPDWNVAFRTLKPLIYDLKSGYADWVTSDVYQIAFAPTVVATTSGASIATYSWDVGDGTITVGAASDKNITATFPAGFRWISFTSTDDQGESQIRYIPIWAHDPDTYPPQLLETGDFTVSASIQDGYNASLTAFDGVDAVLDQTLVCAWVDESYNGTKQHIDQNVAMIGRLRSESNRSDYGEEGNLDASVTFEVEGVITQMQRIRASALEIARSASPDAFNEVDDLTIWRAVHLFLTEYSTFAELHSLYFDDVGTTFAYGTLTTAGQNMHGTIIDLAESLNAVFQCSGTGECEFVRKAVYLDSNARDALATVMDMSSIDILGSLGYEKQHIKPVGYVRADGGGYKAALDAPSAYLAAAPAGTPATGADEVELRRQVLQANQTAANEQAELVARVGNALAEAQNADTIPITLPDGYWFLVPDAAAWYTVTLDGTELAKEIVLDDTTRWILSSIELVFSNETGTAEVSAVLTIETLGEDGEIVPLPSIETEEYPVDLGEFDEPIDLPIVVPEDTDFDFTDDDGGWEPNDGSHSPGDGWEPDCIGGTHEVLDIYYEFGVNITLTGMSCVYDAVYGGGADNDNAFLARAPSGDWYNFKSWTTVTGNDQTESVDIDPPFVCDAIRLIQYAGGNDCTGDLILKAFNYEALDQAGEWSHTFDFTISQYGFEFDLYSGEPEGAWIEGTGLVGLFRHPYGSGGAFWIRATLDLGADVTFTKAEMWYDYDPLNLRYRVRRLGGYLDEVLDNFLVDESDYGPPVEPEQELYGPYGEWEATGTVDSFRIVVSDLRNGYAPAQGTQGEVVVRKVIVYGTGVNPFA